MFTRGTVKKIRSEAKEAKPSPLRQLPPEAIASEKAELQRPRDWDVLVRREQADLSLLQEGIDALCRLLKIAEQYTDQ